MEKVRNIKTLLAKLMATENISVKHQAVQTASFDVVNRVLTLPVYKDDLSNDELDLFVGHEVGHALFTPSTDLATIINGRKHFKDFLNIVEDARIEKLIQRRFPGLRKNFVGGYNGLVERGFFGKDKDINTYNFIDRLNIYFKTRNSSVEFSAEEQIFVDAIENLEDWDSTVELTEKLFEYCGKKGQEKEEEEIPQQMQPQTMSDNDEENSDDMEGEEMEYQSDSSDGDEEEDEDTKSQNGEGDETEQDGDEQETADTDDDGIDDTESNQTKGGVANEDELESETAKQFEKGMQEIVDTNVGQVFETPLYKVPKHITSIERVWELIQDSYKGDHYLAFNKGFKVNSPSEIEEKLVDLHSEFIRSQKSVLNYMVKEFEMKKKADEYKRTREAKTGTLNMSKLYNYKFSEDLFLKNNVTKDGKSHGMVMLVDWSGSMYGQLADTLQQTQILTAFCQKVNIPFDVYAFTDQMYDRSVASPWAEKDYTDGEWNLGAGFSLMHLASSTFNRTQKEMSNKAIAFFKTAFDRDNDWGVLMNRMAKELHLGQTPIASSLLSMFPILKDFQNSTHVDILNLVCLTDGEGQCRATYDNNGERGRLGYGYSSNGHFIFKGDKADYTLQSYPSSDEDYRCRPVAGAAIADLNRVETNLYDILRKEFDNLRITGFYLAEGTGKQAMYRIHNQYVVNKDECLWSGAEDAKKITKQYNEKKFMKPDKDVYQYDNLFIVKGSSMQINDTWEVDEKTVQSTAKLRKSFSKMMSNKVTDRVLASNFIEVIA